MEALDRKARDIMVPISDYAVVRTGDTLREAALSLRLVYCETSSGACTEAGHRTALVLDALGNLVGILDFRTILSVFIPEIAGSITEKLKSLGISVAFAEAGSEEYDEIHASLRARVLRNAETPVTEVMLNVRGVIDGDADLLDALKTIYRNKITVLPVMEEDKVIGVIRDSDLFLTVTSILAE